VTIIPQGTRSAGRCGKRLSVLISQSGVFLAVAAAAPFPILRVRDKQSTWFVNATP
jgi:hypothetical protein